MKKREKTIMRFWIQHHGKATPGSSLHGDICSRRERQSGLRVFQFGSVSFQGLWICICMMASGIHTAKILAWRALQFFGGLLRLQRPHRHHIQTTPQTCPVDQ